MINSKSSITHPIFNVIEFGHWCYIGFKYIWFPEINLKNQAIKMMLPFHKILTLILFALILIQCSEKNSAEYVQEGLEYLKHQKYDSARESFLKAIEKDSNNSEGYYSLGGIYI